MIDRQDQTIYEQLDGERRPDLDAFEVLTPELQTLVARAGTRP